MGCHDKLRLSIERRDSPTAVIASLALPVPRSVAATPPSLLLRSALTVRRPLGPRLDRYARTLLGHRLRLARLSLGCECHAHDHRRASVVAGRAASCDGTVDEPRRLRTQPPGSGETSASAARTHACERRRILAMAGRTCQGRHSSIKYRTNQRSSIMPASIPNAPVGRSPGHAIPAVDRRPNDDFLRIRDVCERTTLSESTIRNMIVSGVFPGPIRLGPAPTAAKVWLECTIDDWLTSRIAARAAMRSPHDKVDLPAWTTEMEHGTSPQGIRMMRRPEVCRRVGYRKSQLQRMVVEGKFPRQVPIGVSARAWVQFEVEEWRRQRIEARRKDPGFNYLTTRF